MKEQFKNRVVSIVHRKRISGEPGSYNPKDLKIVSDMVSEAMELIGSIDSIIKPGDRVVIKPNAVWPIGANAAITTDPRVVESVILPLFYQISFLSLRNP